MRYLIIVLIMFGIFSCSEDSNFNQLLVSQKQKDSFEVALSRATIAYDKGNYSKALDLAQKAYSLSPDNEEVNILLGYIYLSLAGIGSFEMVDGMLTVGKTTAKLTTASNDGAAALFSKITAVMEVSDEDLQKLGELSHEENLEYFKAYDVILPKTAPEARKVDLDTIQNLNLAIKHVCPFVDEDVRLPDADERHAADACPSTQVTRQRSMIAHFLWIFSHVAEASVFYAVLTYGSKTSGQSHIQKRTDALDQNLSKLSLSDYANYLTSLSTTIDSVFDVNNKDSMITAVLNDITAANLAAASMAGLPASFKDSITKAVDSIKTLQNQAPGSSEDEKQANALKNQFNKAAAKEIESQISQLATEDPEGFAQEKDEICSSYQVIAGTTQLPPECQEK